jgi:hypothetical protein
MSINSFIGIHGYISFYATIKAFSFPFFSIKHYKDVSSMSQWRDYLFVPKTEKRRTNTKQTDREWRRGDIFGFIEQ